MRKLIAIFVIIFAAVGADAADVRPYVSQKLSYAGFWMYNPVQYGTPAPITGTKENRPAFGGLAALGAEYAFEKINGAVRAELEFGIHSQAAFVSENMANPALKFSAKQSITTYGLNLYYDFNVGKGFKPYVGLGAGLARIGYELASDNVAGSGAATDFYWNMGLGLSYAVLPDLDIDLGYRYSNFGKFKGGLEGYGPLLGHTFEAKADLFSYGALLGLRYKF